MAMKRCPICGEKYSDTYKSCPFCEEEEALQSGAQIRRTAPGRGGKRTAARGRQPNLLSPILIVLIVIMAALLVYLLFGDRIAQRLSGGEETQDASTEDVTPQPPNPDTADSEGGDGVTMPESGGTGEIEDPNDGGTTTPAQTDPSTLPETLTIAYLGSPRTEFTMSVGDEPIPLTVSGGSGTYTWSSSDDGIASVDSTGRVTAITRWAVSFKSSRRQCSKKPYSTTLADFATPMRSQKFRMALGVYPRRRSPQRVGIRGSSQPETFPSSTKRRSLRLLITVWSMPRRANSICRGL